ncbi:uncharacterized protein LOC116667143 [Camelus ferus]|uniref:Uncharacterized protein LOC116667143 n=1 Tax=Camelus ferus TaxID=419612 RepID=A0A8B8TZ94_CAMFR|nr:uncharacterized protein LOC116667143 [Camelus ferus]
MEGRRRKAGDSKPTVFCFLTSAMLGGCYGARRPGTWSPTPASGDARTHERRRRRRRRRQRLLPDCGKGGIKRLHRHVALPLTSPLLLLLPPPPSSPPRRLSQQRPTQGTRPPPGRGPRPGPQLSGAALPARVGGRTLQPKEWTDTPRASTEVKFTLSFRTPGGCGRVPHLPPAPALLQGRLPTSGTSLKPPGVPAWSPVATDTQLVFSYSNNCEDGPTDCTAPPHKVK